MDLSIKTHLRYATTQPCDLLLQVEALSDAAQGCRATRLVITGAAAQQEMAGEPDTGPRKWITAAPEFECRYETRVRITRPDTDLDAMSETPRLQIPGPVIPYLMPSRYCQSDLFLNFVESQFGTLTGGPLIRAMNDWVHTSFTYDNGVSDAGTTATDSFMSLSGVCRDYAHMLIALARAGGIPARFVSAYAPDVVPQDFHALVEVYLDGAWHLTDPTGMSRASEVARICVGRDAADASFLTSYGWIDLLEQTVDVTRVYG